MTADGTEISAEELRRGQVRDRYGRIASGSGEGAAPTAPTAGGCGEATGSCCGDSTVSIQLGYQPDDLKDLPEGANLGLGCGNPTRRVDLRPGDVVMDLGSGAGIDCFLAAKRVGPTGRVIGADMTPEMVARARANARQGGYPNVEFRLGEIEHLPAADASVDVVVSNCVINLAPEKGVVYREAFRVLRPGGRFAVSDVVATRPITKEERDDPSLWASCSSGALEVEELTSLLRAAGFEQVDIELRAPLAAGPSAEGRPSLGVVSADMSAIKPG